VIFLGRYQNLSFRECWRLARQGLIVEGDIEADRMLRRAQSRLRVRAAGHSSCPISLVAFSPWEADLAWARGEE
jgi:hypothetical protein